MSTSVLYDPTSPDTLEDPYAAYARLRDQAPVYFIEKWNTWVLSRFEDIWNYSNSQEHFSAASGTTPPYLVSHTIEPGVNLNHMDPPQQRELRAELLPTFLRKSLESMEVELRSKIVDCLDPLITAGKADAFTDIGQVIAVQVAAMALGLPEEDAEQIQDFMQRFFSAVGGIKGTEEIGAKAMTDMRNYLTNIASQRRKYEGPAENLVDIILQSRSLGHIPTDDEVGEHLVPLLVGASETFPKLASAAIYRLWQHQNQRQELIDNPALIPNAVLEMLRFDMPTQMSMRKVVKELCIHDKVLEPGQSVMFLWASGNRDERQFPGSERFDIHRRLPRTLSFGHGIHRCLGAKLAELEGRILLEELLQRAPRYQVDEANVSVESNAFFHAFARMPVTFTG